MAYPLEISFSHLRYHVILGHSRSNRSSVIIETCQTILTSQAPPFRVTRGHWNWQGSIATYDFLLVFRSNYGPISFRFRDKERYLAKFSHPLYLTPRWGVPLEFCNALGTWQTAEKQWRKHLSYVTAECGLPQLEWNLSSCIFPKKPRVIHRVTVVTRFHVW